MRGRRNKEIFFFIFFGFFGIYFTPHLVWLNWGGINLYTMTEAL